MAFWGRSSAGRCIASTLFTLDAFLLSVKNFFCRTDSQSMQDQAQNAFPGDSPPEAQIRAGTDEVVLHSLRTVSGWTLFIVGVNTLADAVFHYRYRPTK